VKVAAGLTAAGHSRRHAAPRRRLLVVLALLAMIVRNTRR
jgi:hypothetical protein